ncbi:MAG: DNA polymerase III subunit delta [Spirochaetia bacterium]
MSPTGPKTQSPAREPPARLLLGPEEGEKSAFIEKITEALAARLGEPPERSRFYAGETGISDIILCLRNMSLFARHRLVIVSNAEEVKRPEEVSALVEYLASPAEDATLLLLSAGYPGDIDRKIAGDQKKKTPGAVPFEHQRVFWELFDNQKQGWVASFFRQRKISIAAEAVEYILDMVENNTRDMRVECERLALFFGPDAVITLESVEQYIYHSKEENVFTLFDTICGRELLSAEEFLDKILLSREADATQLVGGLLMQFRKLASYKRMRAANYESAEAFPKLRIFSKKNQKTYAEGSRMFSSKEIERIVQLLVEFDERFRSAKADLHDLLLRLMVYYVVAKAGQGAWRLSL